MNKKLSRLRRARKAPRKHCPAGSAASDRASQWAAHLCPGDRACGGQVLAAASTVQKDVCQGLESTCNKAAAAAVGSAIAEKAKAAGVEQVAFDRSGFRYHGRVKELADAARAGGLKF